jgi:hypothetical protein
MFVTTSRALGWALARKPLVRQLRPVNSTPSTLMDALDLVSNFRGMAGTGRAECTFHGKPVHPTAPDLSSIQSCLQLLMHLPLAYSTRPSESFSPVIRDPSSGPIWMKPFRSLTGRSGSASPWDLETSLEDLFLMNPFLSTCDFSDRASSPSSPWCGSTLASKCIMICAPYSACLSLDKTQPNGLRL